MKRLLLSIILLSACEHVAEAPDGDSRACAEFMHTTDGPRGEQLRCKVLWCVGGSSFDKRASIGGPAVLWCRDVVEEK